MYVKNVFMDFKNPRNSYWMMSQSLRDLCVRWSFGRCFNKVRECFLYGLYVPYVDYRIANLEWLFPAHLSLWEEQKFSIRFGF